MYIKSIYINNFKCYKETIIHFDDNLNVIIGKNNSGKSTIFEALRLWQLSFNKFLKDRTNNQQKSSFLTKQYYSFTIDDIFFLRINDFRHLFHKTTSNKNNKFHIRLTFKDNDNEVSLPILYTLTQDNMNLRFELCNNGDERISASKNLLKVLNKTIGASFKNQFLITYINPIFSLPNIEVYHNKGYILNMLHNAKANEVIRNMINEIAPKYFQTQNTIEKTEKIISLENKLHEILFDCELDENNKALYTFFSNFKSEENKYIELIAKSDLNTKVEINQLGSGTINLLNILSVISYVEYRKFKLNALLLDEPDSHLHYDHQKSLLKYLKDVSKESDKQIFIITHNHELIDNTEKVLYIKEKEKEINPICRDEYYKIYKDIALDHHKRMIELVEKKEVENELKTVKTPTIFCEGDSDVFILQQAFCKLYNTSDFFGNLVELRGGSGASGVAASIKYSNENIISIGILDRDKEGIDQFEALKKNSNFVVNCNNENLISKQNTKNNCCLLLPVPSFRNEMADFFQDNTFIEYLFDNNALISMGVELEQKTGNTYFTIKGVKKNNKLNFDKQKHQVVSNVRELNSHDFYGFIPVFEAIADVLNYDLLKLNER